jgi:hypothetical protein
VVHHVIERSMFRTRLQETKRLAFCRRTVLETHVCMCQIRAYRGPGPLRCSIGKLGRNWGLKAPLQSGKRLTAFRSEKSFRYFGLRKDGFWEASRGPHRREFLRINLSGKDLDIFESVLEICPWGSFALWALFFPWSESKRDACGRAAVWPLHKTA